MAATASASPSKRFFVEMLTRDIALIDAVLDLIDNCVDGIQRQLKSASSLASKTKPYEGYWAKLTLNQRGFSIMDNCGGIPRGVAEKYAFRLGRPADMPAENLPTVGVYGIGMKRALFKLGRSAKVTTLNAGKAYAVGFSKQWMEADNDWDLPIAEVPRTKLSNAFRGVDGGTLIEVDNLIPSVAEEFNVQSSTTLTSLMSTIATHFSYIIHKGFAISINGSAVRPMSLNILVSAPNRKQRVEPYVYTTNVKGVTVDLIIGLYRNIPSQQEVDAELLGRPAAGSKDTCGWTIICNDRVVVYNDKSRLTGWGEAGVPAYHPQFNAIAGIVHFQSTSMSSLPVTTTKRGLEAGSDLYLGTKDHMREGLKTFTNFTNHWKGSSSERLAMLEEARPTDPFEAARALKRDTVNWSEVRKGLGGRKYVPSLPKPPKVASTDTVIRFVKSADDLQTVREFLFEDQAADASAVGEKCFDRVLAEAQR